MNTFKTLSLILANLVLIVACSGSGNDDELPQAVPEEDPTIDPLGQTATYRITIKNHWGVDEFPQGFPDDAHLSLIGGASHNAAVSFWQAGDIASPGIEDMAEAGLIDRLLSDEVAPAIDNGTADSKIEFREFTGPSINGVAGQQQFEVALDRDWPLVTLVTMLGPSPDWFVGVSGQSLLSDDEQWFETLEVDLPLFDAGTKSDITPVMGGPDIVPPLPIGPVAYDASTGVYLPSEQPQNVVSLVFERLL